MWNISNIISLARLVLSIPLAFALIYDEKVVVILLALVALLSFLLENGYGFRENYDKSEFSEYLDNLFPEFDKYEDEKDFTPIEYAYYNLTIIIPIHTNDRKYGICALFTILLH